MKFLRNFVDGEMNDDGIVQIYSLYKTRRVTD
jgi:hypothetical protein